MLKRNFLLIISFLLSTSLNSNQENIKLYAFYTPSHKVFVDEWFLPSMQDDYEIILECHEQKCWSGKFLKKGWLATMLKKVDLIIRGIQENCGEIFIHSDVDIQFFAPTKELILHAMQNKDIVIQRNAPDRWRNPLCAGFFACRGNEKTLKLWQMIRQFMITTGKNDQDGLNYFLRRSNHLAIRWGYLPDTFFCGGTFTAREWKPGKPLCIPKGIVLHHANWTIGIPNKIAQLHYVRNEVEQLQNQVS